MLNNKVEKIASDLLERFRIHELPIPLNKIIKSFNVTIKPYELGENISGLLVIDSGVGTIGINPNDSKVRQRFTLAHELGHYILHKHETELFIDKEFTVLFRNQKSSTGEIKREQEANAFAASILMPKKFLVEEISRFNFDLNDENSIKKLSKTFEVSSAAMAFRISNLSLF